ncbi:hypothetical protein NDU88_004084, partial [Pleurodeles waltl]
HRGPPPGPRPHPVLQSQSVPCVHIARVGLHVSLLDSSVPASTAPSWACAAATSA